jgi:ppGpp synthetase/RelA/SpoT-type nucleotidyltranferase
MALTPHLIDAAVERYLREFDRYEKLSKCIGETCRTLLEKLDIRCSVQWRPKDSTRLRRKLEKYLASGEHAAEFTDLDSVFRVLKDLAGTRITTYVDTDRVRVVALVQEWFSGFGANSTIVPDVKDQPFGFYRATHCMVHLKDEEAVGQFQNLKGLGCEIQVCSLLAHVFNELEHDLRYKPLSGDLSNKENALLNAVARQLEVGDTLINLVRDAVEARQTERIDELAARQVVAAKPEASFRDNPFLNIVADSPLLLKLSGLVQSSRPERDLPETPAHFYQEMIRLLANGALSSVPEPDADALLAILPPIAWQLFSRDPDADRCERSTLLETIARVTNSSQADAAKLLAKMIELGLFVLTAPQSGEEHLQLAHTIFRDFLAASRVASQINRDGWDTAKVETWRSESGWSMVNVRQMLDDHAFEPNWQSLFVFVAGLMNEPLGLLQILADRHKDDLYRHRLGLLCRCYRALSASRQSNIAPKIESVFAEVLQIAKRCEHDDAGHSKPWLEWVEMLLPSANGAERLCGGLLTLDGRYYGWAVSLKVLELFERVLTQGKVTPSVVNTIAQVGERDEHQWGVNTARLALRLAEHGHRQKLVSRFVSILENAETPDRVKIRLAEAISTAEDTTASRRAGEMLIAMAQADSLTFENSEKAVNGLVSLLETSLAPIAAPLLINHLLNPSSHHHFWLAWRIIGKSEREPDSPWSAVFLGIILFADREDDRRLKLWSAQVLSKHSQPDLRDLGLRTLLGLMQERKSHSWVHAARWLVEYGPVELAEKAREALLSEASRHESDHQRVATAELLEMGVVDPQGGPIQNVVREAVLRELDEHGQKYGSRLHVTAPGAPKGNVDLELFTDNPAGVIKLLHTFNGPSFYLRDRDDPNEEEKKMRHWNAKLLQGTRYWPEVLRSSIQAINDGADCGGPVDDGAMGIVLFGGRASELLGLLRKTFERGRSNTTTRHYLLDELYERGWRLRLRGRQIEVLHKGKEEPSASDVG